MTYYERNLPHWHPPGKMIFVTWRLHGSLPREVLVSLKKTETRSNLRFARAERYLDNASSGPLWLSEARVAEAVTNCIRHGAEVLAFYRLISFVVMPNHVHLLLDPRTAMKRITGGIKSVSSREANRILGREGQQFWQAESFDHWVRNGAEAEKIRLYIEQNPVRAGLTPFATSWPWSSAAKPAPGTGNLPVQDLAAWS